MIPSISTFNFEQAVSTVIDYQIELATQCWPWLLVAGAALVVGGFAVYKIASALLERELREAKKPIIAR